MILSTILTALIAVKGPHAMSTMRVVSTFNRARKQIESELGVHQRLVRIKVINRNPYQTDLQARAIIIYATKKFVKRHKGLADIYFFALPPLIGNGQQWLAGQASSVCQTHNGWAWAALEKKAPSGANRLEHDRVAFMHETGHLLGCFHDEAKPNIMHPDALSLVDSNPPLHFRWVCQMEVIDCQEGRI